jgi:hypothetical protein
MKKEEDFQVEILMKFSNHFLEEQEEEQEEEVTFLVNSLAVEVVVEHPI